MTRERSVTSGRSWEQQSRKRKEGLDSHAWERVVSKEGICGRFSNTWPVGKERKDGILFDVVVS